MNIPEPVQLPSGNWRIQVLVGKKRVGRTFHSAKEAIYWAAGLKTEQQTLTRQPKSMTVGAAIDRYIDSKDAVISPTTLRSYKAIRKKNFSDIEYTQLKDLHAEQVQRWVNALSKTLSPKSVKNCHGLLTATLAEYYPDLVLRTTLPQRRKTEIQIPTADEAKKILKASEGTQFELPISLAIYLGLRQSEILGLKWDDIKKDTIYVHTALVRTETGIAEKGTKSYSGTRTLHIPAKVKKLLAEQRHDTEHIVNLSASSIYNGFSRICARSGVPHYRFHDLRHLNASIMLAAGVPDKYGMKRMGHATNNMLKNTYQHVMRERENDYDKAIEQEFIDTLET